MIQMYFLMANLTNKPKSRPKISLVIMNDRTTMPFKSYAIVFFVFQLEKRREKDWLANRSSEVGPMRCNSHEFMHQN